VRIDTVQLPSMEGKSPAEFLKEVEQKLGDTMQLVMKLNNEIESLKARVASLEQGARFA
jgi:hypothetical protein